MFAVKVIDLFYRVFNFFQVIVIHGTGIDLLLLQVFDFGADLWDSANAGECHEPEQPQCAGHQQEAHPAAACIKRLQGLLGTGYD